MSRNPLKDMLRSLDAYEMETLGMGLMPLHKLKPKHRWKFYIPKPVKEGDSPC